MPSLIDVVVRLGEAFDGLRIRYALGGALASNYWGVVRATQDIDFLIALPAIQYQQFADALNALGCTSHDDSGQSVPITVEQLLQEVRQRKLFECFLDSIRIELFVPAIPLQEEILRRTVRIELGGREIPLTTAEDLILLKLAFHRAKDLQDVRGILWVQRGRLDLAYIRHWSGQTLDQDTRKELEHLIDEYCDKDADNSGD